MIFDNNFLDGLKETGINSHNLKMMIMALAVKCSELEKELKHGNTESDTARTDSAD